MTTTRISFYKNHAQIKSKQEVDISLFLEDVKNGKWQDIILPIRAEKDDVKRRGLKAQLPAVTLSGLFSERKDEALVRHSGFLAIDLDDLNIELEPTRLLLSADPYTFAAFTSASGTGLCIIFHIDGNRHRDAFEAISAYFYNTYRLIIDSSCRNESRLRYASFDPHIYINPDAILFKRYLPKEKKIRQPQVVFVQTDFDELINQLSTCNIGEDYQTWCSIGYALADKFGPAGEDYYHALSSSSSKYNAEDCRKMYVQICKSIAGGGTRPRATIGTIYYHAKTNNIPFYSEQTRQILSSAGILQRSGLKEEGIIQALQRFDNVDPAISTPIVQQAIAAKIEVNTDSVIDKIESWLKYNYELTRNVITRKILVFNRDLDNKEFNNLFIAAKKIFDKDVTAEILDKLVNSSFTPDFNPFTHFLTTNTHEETGYIDEYTNCFETDDKDYFYYFFNKWYAGVIASALGNKSDLMLVYTGRQGSGKTESFRQLLPPVLSHYYAESKLDAGKDDEILMTQKLIICDDEMGGKNKMESRRLKDLTSKRIFSIRSPYGRYNEDMRRIAVLCGTTNDPRVKNDASGNRRIIVTDVRNIDFPRINKIDRAKMFVEMYNSIQGGWTHELEKDEIIGLNLNKEAFEDYSLEYELLVQYCSKPTAAGGWEELSATDIKVQLEHITTQKLNLNKIGSELQRQGYIQEIKRIDGKPRRIYKVVFQRQAPPAGWRQAE
jgi:predicted P-loop ATPase